MTTQTLIADAIHEARSIGRLHLLIAKCRENGATSKEVEDCIRAGAHPARQQLVAPLQHEIDTGVAEHGSAYIDILRHVLASIRRDDQAAIPPGQVHAPDVAIDEVGADWEIKLVNNQQRIVARVLRDNGTRTHSWAIHMPTMRILTREEIRVYCEYGLFARASKASPWRKVVPDTITHYDALRGREVVMRGVRADVKAEIETKLAGDITWRPCA